MANKRTSALTDIGEALVDADEIPIANASDTAETRKSAMSRVWTYIDSKLTYKPSGTDVAVADGGTGASDAPTARTNLGVVNNATHTGEVTGSTALTVDKTAITGKTLVTPVAGADHVLIADASDSDNLKKAVWPTSGGGGAGTFPQNIPSGEYFLLCPEQHGLAKNNSILSSNVANSNALTAFVRCYAPSAIDTIAFRIQTASDAGGAGLRLALYENNAGVPGALIEDLGIISITSTGKKEIACTSLSDDFWIGFKQTANASATVNTQYWCANNNVLALGSAGTSVQDSSSAHTGYRFATETAGAWDSAAPDPAPSTSFASKSIPTFYGQVI